MYDNPKGPNMSFMLGNPFGVAGEKWAGTELKASDPKSPFADRAHIHELQKKIGELENNDALTSLASKSGFKTKAEALLAQKLSGRQNGHTGEIAVIRIDLDGFKPVNDTYGHHAGDEYLKIFSKRLQHFFRGDDVVARVSGDEFSILAVDTDVQKISDKMAEIFEASKKWEFGIDRQKIPFRGFSYGVSSTKELDKNIPVEVALCQLDKTADARANDHKKREGKAATSARSSDPLPPSP